MGIQALRLMVSVSAAIAGGCIAFHYPLAQPLAIIGFALVAVLVFFRPWCWPILIPGALPLIGLAPWTGWLSFEELDLLALATAAGGYANWAAFAPREGTRPVSKTLVALAGLMAVSLLISMFRGFADAGGFSFGWFQGYDGPMNSVRIAKSFFLALLLLPLLNHLRQQNEARLTRHLGLGLAVGLGSASLAAIWERLAFTDLLNFSSDYRSTALFWEMHVGGAALDGWLVLTLPFAIWELKTARSAARAIPAFVLVAIAAYASLTTFSRGVYLALIIALPLLAWLLHKQEKSFAATSKTTRFGALRWIISVVVLAILALFVFHGSGYRGLLALLGIVMASTAIPSAVRTTPRAKVLVAITSGGLLGVGLVALASVIPKGPYVLYAALFGLTLAALHFPARPGRRGPLPLALISFSALAVAAANVAWHWGGAGAAVGMLYALAILIALLVWAGLSAKPLWPNDIRWQATLLTVGLATCGVIAIFSGGAYMGDRFSTSEADTEHRVAHWRNTLDMLRSPSDFMFGKGLGRFPANYFFSIPDSAFPGTYKLGRQDNNGFLTITGGNHPISFGDLFRVSQRLDISVHGPFELGLRVRAKRDVTIHAEVCEKHLLYVARCVIRNVRVKATNNQWENLQIQLRGPLLGADSPYIPRLKMFSIGIESQAGVADLDDLVLTEAGSQNLLANADFSTEMRRWFFSSDRDHLPWHAKNMQLNTLFDQGLLGLVATTLLLAVALWRLNVGRYAHNALAPYITASLVGFLVVGLFDSLTDVPRVAFVYYLLILYSIAQTGSPKQKLTSAGLKGRH